MSLVRQSIPVARPVLDRAEADAAGRAILSGWVTQGPEVHSFEREFAAAVGAPHACAVSNCTTALHLALRAAGVGPGDEVVTVSHSFIASANAVRYCGATPVFVDIDPATFNMDASRVDAAVRPRTRAILAVHQLGMPCDMAKLVEIARRRYLPLIEDAACAAGSEILWNGRWEPIGKPHGDAACFSFHPRKVITTGDGGMITTRHEDWDTQFRLWRQHGMSIPDTVRHHASSVTFEEYPTLGYNYRMTDIQAAVGREQLKRLAGIVARRRELANRYRERLAGRLPQVVLPHEPEWARSNWQSFCVRLPRPVDQRAVMQAMLERGISTRRGVMCAHQEAAYASEPWHCGDRGPVSCVCGPRRCRALAHSEQATREGLILPLFTQMTDVDQDEVVDALAAALSLCAV
ncbi:MAG: DegT/DnrJ/EryC1/StrS family aminotransferase [Acidobacteria bacterium]|nr:DegT/DnrJ/EryC1/StrS family aminotransferase [Acidobacteriota bacterium]